MYKIIIRNQEPVFIENGEELLKLWQENKLPARMVIKNVAFMCADIRSIMKLNEEPSVGTHVDNDSIEKEYRAHRARLLSMTPLQRSEVLTVPRLLWNAYNLASKTPMPLETQNLVKERQLAFFEKNPNRIYANPSCYRDLIEAPLHIESDDKKMNPASNFLVPVTLKIVGELIYQDGVHAR